jgi:glycerophosphoryl diester phosphodiesterase
VPERRRAPAIPVGATAGLGWRLTGTRLGRWLLLTAVVQGAVVLLAAPLLFALFQAGLAAAGIATLTTTTATTLLSNPGAALLLVLFLVLSVVALVLQAGIIAIAADLQQASPTGAVPRPRAIGAAIARRLRALGRPSTLLLLPYLLLLAPLGHAALGSLLTRWVAIPNFISGELMRSPAGSVLWILISIALWYVNLRLVLTVPFLAVGGMTAPQAFRASWAATRWRSWRVIAILLAVTVPAAIALVVLAGLALAATAVSDAVAPDASPVVAAVSFAVAELGAFFVVGIAVVIQTQAFVRIVRLAAANWSGAAPLAPPASPLPRLPVRRGLRWAAAGTGVAVAAGIAVLALIAAPLLDRYADGSTLVIAHRGDVTQAVENTIPALEAAHAAGADVVEFDVQQTKDGDWVVMHDFDLNRLAGSPAAVKDMTLAEATAITVRENGFEGQIPSMREWVHRAKELDQTLLIEIKPHGGETADYLESFYAILDEEGVTTTSLYHSLSEAVVDGQLAMRPETVVGLIVPISFGSGVPATEADFLVVEEFSYTDALTQTLHDQGRGLFVWTVDDAAAMRGYLRDGVDGIVTDQVALALEQREDVSDEQGLAPKLLDALSRAVTLW